MYLIDFIDDGVARLARSNMASRAHVEHPGFEKLYVRLTRHFVGGVACAPVLDIADVAVFERHRGQRVFTDLIAILRGAYPRLHLRVENVFEDRFQNFLKRSGFLLVDETVWPPSFLLPAGDPA